MKRYFPVLLCGLAMVSSAAMAADKILIANLKPTTAQLYVSAADGSGDFTYQALLHPEK